MIAIPLVQLIVFVVYNLYIYDKYGALPSVSDSYYELKKNGRETYFTFFIWTLAIPMLFLSGYSGLYFASASFLMFVGVATAFKEKGMTRTVHVVGATGSIFFGLLALVTESIWFPVLIASVVSLWIRYKKYKNPTLLIEIVCCLSIIAGIIYKFI